MELTKERATLLSDYLMKDTERTKELFNMMPEEALERINADGNDFTLAELKEYGENLQTIASQKPNGELDVEELDDVSGGLCTAAVIAIYGVAAAGGIGVGVCAYKGWW